MHSIYIYLINNPTNVRAQFQSPTVPTVGEHLKIRDITYRVQKVVRDITGNLQGCLVSHVIDLQCTVVNQ